MTNLSEADLGRADLYGANLYGANLRMTNLRMTNLSMADLYGANLRGADLRMSNLSIADLNGANLSGANLGRAHLGMANLYQANLGGADLERANLSGANLSGADLCRANLRGADLYMANLSGADLGRANLSGANLYQANLGGANLRGANLSEAILVRTDLANAVLTGCRVYGISAWDVKLSEETNQQDLVITPPDEPEITADDLEVAQFIYLMLRNEKLKNIIDTITSKVVLILGRFSLSKRKRVLDALRDELRKRNYVPVVFDFEQPGSRTTDETIMLLARMARFVIADISDAKSVLQELRGIVPDLPTVPVQPIIVADQDDPGMFDHFKKYPWFLKVRRYKTSVQLLAHLDDWVIGPLEDRGGRPEGRRRLRRAANGKRKRRGHD